MPRDGSGIYTYPPGTPGVPDATISSTAYNNYIADVQQDLNLPRPIVAGGTGANSAATARANMGAEVAMQTVTNYGSHPWETGSFKSAAGATNSPQGIATDAFAGIAQVIDANNIVVEARNMATGIVSVMRKIAGVWSAWVIDSGSDKVAKAGDTMTGNLIQRVPANNATLILDHQTVNFGSVIVAQSGGVDRWTMFLDAGGPTSDFLLRRHNDAGAVAGDTTISRANGQITHAGGLTLNGSASINGTLDVTAGSMRVFGYGGLNTQGVIFLNNTNDRYLIYDAGAARYQLATAPLLVNGLSCTAAASFTSLSASSVINAGGAITSTFGVVASDAATFPKFVCKQSGTDRAQFYYDTNGGQVTIHNIAYSQTMDLMTNGYVRLGTGLNCRAGAAGAYGSSCVNFNWTGALACWVDSTNLGNISFTSDYRIKKDVADLGSTWEAVRALRPVSYTQTDYTPAGSDTPLFAADDTERWGFLAHELQETLIPSAATGVKDDPVNIQSPNPWTIIAALTKTIQEMQARIEALEDRALEAGL